MTTLNQGANQSGNSSNAIISGVVGSVCLLISSWFLGTIPAAAHDNFAFIMPYRQILPLTYFMVALGITGAVLHVTAWAKLALAMRENPQAFRIIIRAAALWTIPLFLSIPMFSHDVFAYFAQGKLLLAGYDPYTTGLSALPGWRSQGVSDMWTESATPYGPLFLWLARAIAFWSQGQIILGILGFKIFAALGIILCFIYIPKVAEQTNISKAAASWLTIANPLFSFAFMISAHNDALMMGLLVAGICYVLDKKVVVGLLLVSAAIAVKPIALLALPFLGILWARQKRSNPSWQLQFKMWWYTALITLTPVVVFGVAIGVSVGWINAFSTPGQTFSFYAPVSYIVWCASQLESVFGGSGHVAPFLIKLFFILITLLAILHLIFIDNPRRTILQRCAIAFGITVALSPVVYGWYVLWVIILVAVSFEHNRKYTLPIIYASILYSISPFAEPMDVSIIVDGSGFVRVFAILLAAFSCYWLIFKEASMQELYTFEQETTSVLYRSHIKDTAEMQNPLGEHSAHRATLP